MLRKAISILLVMILLGGCVSRTLIKSFPEGATVFIDSINEGVTPLVYSDMAVTGTEKKLRLEKEGYKPLETEITKDKFQVLPCIGTVLCIFPVVWLFGYPEEQTFKLEKLPDKPGVSASAPVI